MRSSAIMLIFDANSGCRRWMESQAWLRNRHWPVRGVDIGRRKPCRRTRANSSMTAKDAESA